MTQHTEPRGKKFQPAPIPDTLGAFYQEDWNAYWDSLSETERQSLRDKARWEHMSLSAVASEWDAA